MAGVATDPLVAAKEGAADDRANMYATIKTGVMGVMDTALIGTNITSIVKLAADDEEDYEENGVWKGAMWCYSISLAVNVVIALLLIIQALCVRFRASRRWNGMRDGEALACTCDNVFNGNLISFALTAIVTFLMLISIFANQAAGVLFQQVTPESPPAPPSP
eukprot:TRINITY_DN6703_c0_g1_i1.p1 TRINITY_DN6703_c0_g1~~TRINITY_DN6703_c0_g1_i1.p1  ORF type:complete len:163 (+),score=43.52 TRINITY_DN6703_c0_g1_i1:42-530(+)